MEVEKRDNRSCAEIGDEGVESQAPVAFGPIFALGKLRVHKKENKDERGYREHAGTPEYAGLVHVEIREKNANERRGEDDVSLVAELRNLAEQPVFEQDEAENGQANSEACRLQFMPEQQRDEQRGGPGVTVMEVLSAPLVRHSDEPRHRIENDNHDGDREGDAG